VAVHWGKQLHTSLMTSLAKLSPGPSSPDFIMPPASCQPICVDQAVRTVLLKSMPTLDDIDITLVQRGDQSRGVVILGAVVIGDQGGRAAGIQGGGVARDWVSGTVGGHSSRVISGAGGTSSALALATARRSRRRSSLMMMKCHPMRTFCCRGGCGYFTS
jgi:hypothetical protein